MTDVAINNSAYRFKLIKILTTNFKSIVEFLYHYRLAIEFWFYLNLTGNFILKIEATYSIARIIKSGCNLTAK